MADDLSPVTEQRADEYVDSADHQSQLEYERQPEPGSSLVARVRGLFGRLFRSEAPDVRLWDLDQTIAAYPDAPSNYVLRGELYLEIGEYELAYADFQRALMLAEEQTQISDWGIIAQAMQDRARDGIIAAVERNRN